MLPAAFFALVLIVSSFALAQLVVRIRINGTKKIIKPWKITLHLGISSKILPHTLITSFIAVFVFFTEDG
ncbi:hypothetical protein D3C75_759070 [compost metagenome]